MEHALTGDSASYDASPKLKAKASNSIFAFPGSGRSAAARRYRDVVGGLLKDLALAERDLSNALALQIRNAAMLVVQIEQGQAEAARGKPVDMLALIRMQNSLARALWALGLGRRRRQDLGQPDLKSYLASKGAST